MSEDKSLPEDEVSLSSIAKSLRESSANMANQLPRLSLQDAVIKESMEVMRAALNNTKFQGEAIREDLSALEIAVERDRSEKRKDSKGASDE